MTVQRIKVNSQDSDKNMSNERESAFYEPKVLDDHEDDLKQDIPYISLYKKLAKDTTGHGLPHINDARGICKVSTWVLLTIAAVAWMVYHCYSIINTYAKYDVSVSLKIESKNQLDFPAVSVCNINPYKYSSLSSTISYVFDNKDTRRAAFNDPDQDEYEEYGFGGTRDGSMLAFEAATEIITSMSDKEKEELGHQRDDFIQDIAYDGYDVPLSSLYYLYNWKYGNCYTFNPGINGSKPIVKSATTGPQWGLRMIFNVEQDEYIPDYTKEAGVRVLIHDQRRTPFPEEDGIDIPVGFSTSIGLRLTAIERLDGKFGNCKKLSTDYSAINVYEDIFPWHNYTLKGCKKTCYQKKLIDTCGCYDYRYLHKGKPFASSEWTEDVCNVENNIEEACAIGIEAKLRNGTLNCADCTEACEEIVYAMTISQSTWPSKNSRANLLSELSNGHSGAETIINGGSFDDNFAQLLVYFEELNYQSVKESPSYAFGQFASDFGGVVGLWVGASVLTCFEYVEYTLDLLVLWISKSKNKRTTKPNSEGGTGVVSSLGYTNKS